MSNPKEPIGPVTDAQILSAVNCGLTQRQAAASLGLTRSQYAKRKRLAIQAEWRASSRTVRAVADDLGQTIAQLDRLLDEAEGANHRAGWFGLDSGTRYHLYLFRQALAAFLRREARQRGELETARILSRVDLSDVAEAVVIPLESSARIGDEPDDDSPPESGRRSRGDHDGG